VHAKSYPPFKYTACCLATILKLSIIIWPRPVMCMLLWSWLRCDVAHWKRSVCCCCFCYYFGKVDLIRDYHYLTISASEDAAFRRINVVNIVCRILLWFSITIWHSLLFVLLFFDAHCLQLVFILHPFLHMVEFNQYIMHRAQPISDVAKKWNLSRTAVALHDILWYSAIFSICLYIF